MSPTTKTITLYTFDELTDRAKETARDWWRGCIDADDFDMVIEDAVRMAELLGIEISTRPVKLMGGGTRQDPIVYWDLYHRESSFQGHYSYRKGAPAAIKAETGASREDASKGDRELLRIAEDLQKLQRTAFYSLTAYVEHSDRRNHNMSVNVERKDDREVTEDQEESLTELMRDFADWIYSQLEAEDEYLNSDEQVDEAIRINEYTFTEDGTRED